MAPPPEGVPRQPLFEDRPGWYLGVSAYWFATSAKWFLVLQLMPFAVAGVVGDEARDLWWGRIMGVGAVWAMVGPALFGYLSDRTRSRFGRRRPYIAAGAALTAAALFALASADQLWMLFAGYLFLQVSDDVGTGPYAAIVPDLVPEERRGRASGVLSQLQLLAQIVAVVLGLALGDLLRIFFALAIINIVCAAIVLRTVRERPADQPPEKAAAPRSDLAARLSRGAREWAAPWRSADFRWVWLTRFLNSLGFYIILTYLAFYLDTSVRVFRLPGITLADPQQALLVLSLIISLAGAASAVYGGRLADRIGRKRVVYVAGWVMFATLVPFALVPVYAVIVLLAPLFGLGYGAYLSATWALAADILPSKEDAAKDMGIWQMSVATPQVVAGLFVGPLIHVGNGWRPGLGYTLAFLFASGVFLAGAVMIRRVRGSR